MPKRGWVLVDSYDSQDGEEGEEGENRGAGSSWRICEMCEVQEIRFVHVMEHEEYPTVLECGCICAGKMCDDAAGVVETETRLRQLAKRRAGWLARKAWKVSMRGFPYINDRELNGVIFPVARGGFGFRIEHRQTKRQMLMSRQFMATERLARLRLFDAMLWVREHRRQP